jgi:hypothetical protein
MVTVSSTSLKGAKDQTVILRRAEHPFLKWDTCVVYAQAEILGADKLLGHILSGAAKMHKDAAPAMLKLVIDGFGHRQTPSTGSGNFWASGSLRYTGSPGQELNPSLQALRAPVPGR